MHCTIYDQDHEAFRASVREFAERTLKPRHEEMLHAKSIARDIWKEAGSLGYQADLVIVAARTDPAGAAKGITLFVVEEGMPGFQRGRKLDKVGQDEADTAELFFTDVRIPDANRLGGTGQGFAAMMRLQNDVLDRCVQLHGGYGYMNEYRVACAWQDARVTKIWADTNEIMKELVGRDLGL